jgi:GT2 family glycosyltransferase
LKEQNIDASVVVFDAGSTDGSVEYVQEVNRKVDTPIHILQPNEGENSSFAAGVNTAIEFAAEEYPELEWCLLYETDNYLKNPRAVGAAIDLLQRREDLGAVGFTVEQHNGATVGYGESFPTVTSFVLGQQLSSLLGLHTPNPTWQTEAGHRFAYSEVVYTSPLLVRYECWEDVGGMDQSAFPFTDSDIDLCWRLHKNGSRCAVLDTTGIVHDNREVDSEWSKERVERFHRSRMKVILRHRDVRREVIQIFLLLRHMAEIPVLLFLSLIGARPLESVANRLKLLRGVFSCYD